MKKLMLLGISFFCFKNYELQQYQLNGGQATECDRMAKIVLICSHFVHRPLYSKHREK